MSQEGIEVSYADRPESTADRVVREERDRTREELRKTPPDAEPTGLGSDRSTTYVAKKLEESREQLRTHKANTEVKRRELLEARKAEARVEAHVDYWREILRKDTER